LNGSYGPEADTVDLGGLRTFAADAKDITEIMGTGLSLRFV
jgi:hypothetical protein